MTDDEQRELGEAKEKAIAAVIEWLEMGDRLGIETQLLAMEFMGSFQQAADKVLG